MNYNFNIIHEVELQRMYVDGRVDNPYVFSTSLTTSMLTVSMW